MRQFIQNITFAAMVCLSVSAYADNNDNDNTAKPEDTASSFQKIIEDYKQHLAKTSPEVREEIKKYRLAIAKLQKQKKDLYVKLSVQAQNYLKQEENFRKRLPVSSEDTIDIRNQQAINANQSNEK